MIYLDVPHRPVGPMVINKNSASSVTLEWRPPLEDGGVAIRSYIIEMCESGGPWKTVGYSSSHETSFTVAGLREGTNYFFRVSAENAFGRSRPLQSDCITASQPIGMITLADYEIFNLNNYYFASALQSIKCFTQ